MSAGLRTYPVIAPETAGSPPAVTQWQRNTWTIPVRFVTARNLTPEKPQPPACKHKRMGRPREIAGLAEVAEIYNAALESGRPAHAVREHFRWYDRRTVDRHIQRARRQGLITAPGATRRAATRKSGRAGRPGTIAPCPAEPSAHPAATARSTAGHA